MKRVAETWARFTTFVGREGASRADAWRAPARGKLPLIPHGLVPRSLRTSIEATCATACPANPTRAARPRAVEGGSWSRQVGARAATKAGWFLCAQSVARYGDVGVAVRRASAQS